MARIGIRSEDRNQYERRAPLTPEAVRQLVEQGGLELTVQSSPIRVFDIAEYEAAGAAVSDSLSDCPIIMGVKEVPPEVMKADTTYVCFSHTIKGQPENMPALKRLLELGCTLIDYEKITDGKGQRLVFFGRFAGLAGMVDGLWALGKRLRWEGIASPFEAIQPAHHYRNLDHLRVGIGRAAQAIGENGLPEPIAPFVCGFAGYGQVSQGAQEIYDLLPMEEVQPSELADLPADRGTCYKVVFKEEHLVRRIDDSQPFELKEYYRHPDRYESDFFQYVEFLTMLVNCIYWEVRYPKLIMAEQFQALYSSGQPRLRAIADITCDINGSLECTTHATDPGSPIYVYAPATGVTSAGEAGRGPVVLAVDALPCEIPVDASAFFSSALKPFVPQLANADFQQPLGSSGLPPELQRATIVYRGKLTEAFQYLESFVD